MADEPALRIPSSFQPALRAFAALSPADRAQIKQSFAPTREAYDRGTLVDSIAETLDSWDRETSASFIEFLLSLYDLQRVLNLDDLGSVAAMVANATGLDIASADRGALGDDLADTMTSPVFRLLAKAQDLALEYERVLDEVRVLTDIRPIFAVDNTGHIDGAIIMHSMRLRYKGRDGLDRYVALDRSRLLMLQVQVNEAVEKHHALEELLRRASLPFVEAEESEPS